ncbi:MAG TPA: GDSL-type esterase/lipase family protein [Nitrobacter sp.]|jgi:acyl-CoA thioesterase-1|nr:GDSL-type esterase/lipase family protein [Nitrobacter sp.]
MKKLLIWALFCFCASLAPANAQIVALGASNVAGKGVDSSEAYPAQLERLLAARGYHVHVANAGVSGDTNEGMLARLDSSVPDGTKVVVPDVSGGAFNARRKTGGNQIEALRTIESRLRARHIKIVSESAKRLVKNYAQSDGVHLTAEGHAQLAARLLPSVIRALH